MKGQIEKIANFIGKTLQEERLSALVNHLRFDAMAKNEAVNGESLKLVGVVNEEGHFIRKGSIQFIRIQSQKCSIKFSLFLFR